jgi:transcriptional regulator with XRE-family HTH domain
MARSHCRLIAFAAPRRPLPPPPCIADAEMLRHLIEAKNVTQVQVARATGIAESTISAVLAGNRRLNREHIEKLARYFHVGARAFLPG